VARQVSGGVAPADQRAEKCSDQGATRGPTVHRIQPDRIENLECFRRLNPGEYRGTTDQRRRTYASKPSVGSTPGLHRDLPGCPPRAHPMRPAPATVPGHVRRLLTEPGDSPRQIAAEFAARAVTGMPDSPSCRPIANGFEAWRDQQHADPARAGVRALGRAR